MNTDRIVAKDYMGRLPKHEALEIIEELELTKTTLGQGEKQVNEKKFNVREIRKDVLSYIRDRKAKGKM